jgi:hypothetical protein
MVHIPLGRFGEAIEQAKAALFLASDDSSFITGTDFKVDGGISSCYVVSFQSYPAAALSVIRAAGLTRLVCHSQTPTGEQQLAAPKNWTGPQ